jgi:hypothetical protein
MARKISVLATQTIRSFFVRRSQNGLQRPDERRWFSVSHLVRNCGLIFDLELSF